MRGGLIDLSTGDISEVLPIGEFWSGAEVLSHRKVEVLDFVCDLSFGMMFSNVGCGGSSYLPRRF